MIQEGIRTVVDGRHLSAGMAHEVMSEMMEGTATSAQIASFITAMRMKGETEEELGGFVTAMRERAVTIRAPEGAVDLCGTGGDGAGTFNISTVASFVVAGAGVPVAKHGNRSVSSRSGSADVLVALGIPVGLGPRDVEKCLRSSNFGFMFAPVFHKSMKNVAATRREIGVRTFFNLIGPMTNPANVKSQLIGVYSPSLTLTVAKVLRSLGTSRAMVVHGAGTDEITNVGRTNIVELTESGVRESEISPKMFGLDEAEPGEISGGSAIDNARTTLSILKGEDSRRTDVVLMNAAAGVYIAGKAADLQEGFDLAKESIETGKALSSLKAFAAIATRLEEVAQSTQDVSEMNGKRIMSSTLRLRAGDICASLLARIRRTEQFSRYLDSLDETLLAEPNVLTVLMLSRILSESQENQIPEASLHRSATSMSESIKSAGGISIIGEYKPSAPTMPPLNVPPPPELMADAYKDGGVAAISVLVEPDFFNGGPELFRAFRRKVRLPMLFKDFVFDKRQIETAHHLGADSVLIIAKALKPQAMDELAHASIRAGIEPLVELHDSSDLKKLLSCECYRSLKLVGLNSRDLRSLEVDKERMAVLRSMMDHDKILIAESGITSTDDIRRLDGFDAVLIGSMFMRAHNIENTVAEAVSAGRGEAR